MRRLVAFLAVVVFSLVGFAPAAGADFFGCGGGVLKHGSSNIRVSVPAGWSGKHGQAAHHAVSAWTRDTNVVFHHAPGGVEFRAEAHPNKGWLAYAYFMQTDGCKIRRAAVVFNTNRTNHLSVGQLRSIAVHELGHTLGLNHIEPNGFHMCTPDTIMLPDSAWTWNQWCRWDSPRSIDRWLINSQYPPAR